LSEENAQRVLLLHEITRIVDEAGRGRDVLLAGHHAAVLFASYPDAHFSIGRIIDELVLAAASEGVAVEMAGPDRNEGLRRVSQPLPKGSQNDAL
jgi:hypothetical protein